MSRLTSRTAKAAVTAGLAVTLTLSTFPAPAIAEALSQAKTAQEQAQSGQQDSQSAETDAETSGTAAAGDASTAETGADEAATTDDTAASSEAAATAEDIPVAEDTQAAPAAAGDVAQVTSKDGSVKGYTSLTAAAAALQDGDKLELLADSSETVNVNAPNVTVTATNTSIIFSGQLAVRAEGVTVANIHFQMQDTNAGGKNNNNMGLYVTDAANVKIENNTFDLPTTWNSGAKEVSGVYIEGASGGVSVSGNTFNLPAHGGTTITYRAITLRGKADAALDGVTVDKNTVNMTGQALSDTAYSVFIDAIGGQAAPNYGIKNVTVSGNTLNGGQKTAGGKNMTQGFLGAGVDGLTFTDNTAKNVEYAIIFGKDGNNNSNFSNVSIGGNDLSSTTYDVFVPGGTVESRTNDEGVKYVKPEKGQATNSAFGAGIWDMSKPYDPYLLFTTLSHTLDKATQDNTPYEVRVVKDATTGVPVKANKNVTLDLNGHEVSGTTSRVDGQLTVKNGSTNTDGTLSAPLTVTGTGSLTVERGTVSGNVTGDASSTVAVSGGTVSGAVTTAGTLFVTGGTASGKLTTQTGANATVSGGSIGEVEAQGGSTVTIAAGSTVTGVVAAADNATVSITGGSFAKAPTGTEGTVTITGGTFDEKPNVLHAEDGKGFKQRSNGKWIVAEAAITLSGDGVANDSITRDVTAGELDEATLKGYASVSVEDYDVSVDAAQLEAINKAIRDKDTTTSTFTLEYTARKRGTNGTTDKGNVKKTLTVTLTDTRAVHTVTFQMPDGSQASAPQSVKDGDKATSPAAPTLEGHDFKGWYATKNPGANDQQFDFNGAIKGDTVIYAVYTAQQRTLTFDANADGATVTGTPGPVSADYGQVPQQPADPKRDGYDFLGWYTDKDTQDDTTAYNWANPLTQNQTLYAKWKIKTFTVTFEANANGDNTVANMPGEKTDVEWNTTVADPTPTDGLKPTRTGYTFKGWFSDIAAQKPFDFANTPITDHTVIYAGWTINGYSLHFEGNGEGDEVTNVPADIPVNHGTVITEPKQTPSRTGYTFDGWYTSDTNQTPDTKFDWTKPVSGDQTLYAKWNVNSYTMSFDSNGGAQTYQDQQVNYGELATDPGTPTRDGYKFDGWYYNNTQWDFKNIAMPADNLKLTAKWTPNDYVATFDENYQGGQTTTETIYHDGTVTAPNPDPKRAGYEFAGWYTDATKQDDSTKYDWNTTVTGPVTLYAKWVANENQVTFDSDGGTPVAGTAVKTDELVSKPNPDPTKVGHDFQGWLGPDGQPWDFENDTVPAGGVTLKAQWSLHKYDVTFDLNGGDSTQPSDQKVEYQKQAQNPGDPKRTGYTFVGWTDESGNAYDFATQVTKDTKLTAQWTANKHTLTFVYNNGAQDLTEDIYYDGTVTEPVDPQREGYDFGGWYTDENFSDDSLYDFSAKVTGDVTLYAKWNAQDRTVKFESNGGSAVPDETARYDATFTEPTAPTREGYDFAGWYTDATLAENTKYDFKSPVKADLTLYAKWTIQKRTLTFVPNGGSEVASQTVDWGSQATKPADPTREGFTFAGWYTDKELTQPYDFSQPVRDDLTLYAKWDAVADEGENQQKGEKDKKDLPQTGDVTSLAAPGVLGAIGSALLGMAAALRRRRNE